MTKRIYLLASLVLALAFCLSACGGGTKHKAVQPAPRPTVNQALSQVCPADRSSMGCALTIQHRGIGVFGSAPSGPLIPDVYEGQGDVNWAAVKAWQNGHGWQAAAIFKLGEFRVDSKASRNASETLRLGFWRAGYWFVRPTGCVSEAKQIISAGHAFSLKVIALDIEVPQVPGYAACLTPAVRAAGFTVVIYTAPGTWPGGSGFGAAPLWQATFGPRPFHWFWNPTLAWQFTDGTFFVPVFIPGIGRDDVSVDLGITKLGVTLPDPYRKYPKRNVVFHLGKRTIRINEYNSVRFGWDGNHCHAGTHARVCVIVQGHLRLLLGRINFLAHNKFVHGHWVPVHPPRWSAFNKVQPLGSRAAGIRHRIN